MRSLVTSIFLCACESWTLTAELRRRIQATEMRHYRKILHISYKDQGRWGTTDDFATSFLRFFLFSTTLPNSRPVHSLMLSSHLFLCLPSLSPTLTVPWLDLMNRRHDHTTAVCVSLRSSGGLRVVQLPIGS